MTSGPARVAWGGGRAFLSPTPYGRWRVEPDLPLESPTIRACAHGVISTILPVLGGESTLLMAAASEDPDSCDSRPVFPAWSRWQASRVKEQGFYPFLTHTTTWQTVGLVLPLSLLLERKGWLQQVSCYRAADKTKGIASQKDIRGIVLPSAGLLPWEEQPFG